MLPTTIGARGGALLLLASGLMGACGGQSDFGHDEDVGVVGDGTGAPPEKPEDSSDSTITPGLTTLDSDADGITFALEEDLIPVELPSTVTSSRDSTKGRGVEVSVGFFNPYYPPGELVRDPDLMVCQQALPVRRVIERIQDRYEQLDTALTLLPAIVDPFDYGVSGFLADTGELGLVFHQEQENGHAYHYFVVTSDCSIAKLSDIAMPKRPQPQIRIMRDYEFKGESLWGIPWPRPLPDDVDLPDFWRRPVTFTGFASPTACVRGAPMFTAKFDVDMSTGETGKLTLSGTPNYRVNDLELDLAFVDMIGVGQYSVQEDRGDGVEEMHIELQWLPGEALVVKETSTWSGPDGSRQASCEWKAHGSLMAPR